MSAPTLGRNLLLAATVIVIATLAAALWVMESPSMQRDRRLDQRRLDIVVVGHRHTRDALMRKCLVGVHASAGRFLGHPASSERPRPPGSGGFFPWHPGRDAANKPLRGPPARPLYHEGFGA